MKIGDYVRTKSNGIQKIDEEGRVNLGLIKPPFKIIKKEELIKSSPNIIDLIEFGDYVNSHKVIYTIGNICKRIYVEYVNMDELLEIKLEQIKSIVTKEQFESMKYEVK